MNKFDSVKIEWTRKKIFQRNLQYETNRHKWHQFTSIVNQLYLSYFVFYLKKKRCHRGGLFCQFFLSFLSDSLCILFSLHDHFVLSYCNIPTKKISSFFFVVFEFIITWSSHQCILVDTTERLQNRHKIKPYVAFID